MARIRQRGSSLEEHSSFSPIYKSFASSLTICLSFSALVLAALILRYLVRRHQCSSFSTPSSEAREPAEKPTHLIPNLALNMSTPHSDSFPQPSSEALPVDPVLGDPLAYVYYPITSGQLAQLADRKAAERASGQDQSQASSSETTASSTEEGDPLEARLDAYIRYFEDRQEGEMWQRRVVHFQPPEDKKQTVK